MKKQTTKDPKKIKTAIGIRRKKKKTLVPHDNISINGYKFVKFSECIYETDHLTQESIESKRSLLKTLIDQTLIIYDQNYNGILVATIKDPDYLSDKYRVSISGEIHELDYRNLRKIGIEEKIPQKTLDRLHSHYTDFM